MKLKQFYNKLQKIKNKKNEKLTYPMFIKREGAYTLKLKKIINHKQAEVLISMQKKK